MSNDYKDLVRDNVLNEDIFLNVTFSSKRRGHAVPWQRVVIRPVLIKGKQHLKFSYFEADKDITKNYRGPEANEKLDQLLRLPFKGIKLKTTKGNFNVQFTKKGKAIIHEVKPSQEQQNLDLAHNRHKNLLIPVDAPDPFLQVIGIMTKDGRIKANMQGKFRQINEFLRLIQQTGELDKFSNSLLQVVDFGCGNAYLTFAIYHYLNHILERSAQVTGVDVKENLLEKHTALCQELGWTNLTFQPTRIIDFEPAGTPDIILALHACDTATDEALAQAIKWQSKLIFCAPCCHHHLQQQLNQRAAPVPFKPVLRHGILKERLGDILTDTFRSLILRLMGYRTDVIEFISTEHTSKNLMIRAVRSVAPGDPKFQQEYRALKALWQVEPYLAQLLREENMFSEDVGAKYDDFKK